jgi:2-oxoglutarate ferredoxin oxidoreductase subunit delta
MAEEKLEIEKKEKVHIFEAWCKHCGICAAFCPVNALAVNKDGLPYLAHPEKCTLCKLCELRCPDFAITVREREKKEKGKVAKQN